jgi:hypothetical protein
MKTALLRTCSRLGISRIARGLTGHGVRVLAYHGFCDGDEALFQPMLFMRAQTFRARLRLLESGYRVVPWPTPSSGSRRVTSSPVSRC